MRPGHDKLSGIIETDETFIVGIEAGSVRKGRGAETKTLVDNNLFHSLISTIVAKSFHISATL